MEYNRWKHKATQSGREEEDAYGWKRLDQIDFEGVGREHRMYTREDVGAETQVLESLHLV